jgi:exopolyphosphatase/guanosine-5'-triphosphate,3'-diphosphate pyrophosphatase
MGIKRLAIDIGTNSVLALLANVEGDRLTVISDRKKTTRLGEGLTANGYLRQLAIHRTAEAITEFVKDAEFDELFMVGTEALRLARNSNEFSKMIMKSTGQEPTIVTGFKEAELTFLGALYNLNVKAENILFIDVGGGSTELVVAMEKTVLDAISIPIGALKLKEITTNDSLESFKSEAKKALEKGMTDIRLIPPFSIIATGGTITSVAAIKEGLAAYNTFNIHGSILTIDNLQEIGLVFEKAGSSGRTRLVPFDPERAELILPGLGIFLAIMGIIEQKSLMVSTGGVRYGLALRPDKLLT